MHIRTIISNVFAELEDALQQIAPEEYTTPSQRLFNATIGQHVRHILELFLCLDKGYASGIINYDDRKRDKRIEVNKDFAIALMQSIADSLKTEDKNLCMEAVFGADEGMVFMHTNYVRELAYNLEHTIHHMALIRVGINELTTIDVSPTFGVAPATIQYRKTCAQ